MIPTKSTSSTSFVDLQGMKHLPFSSVTGTTTDGINSLFGFLSEGRSRRGPGDAQIGRTSFVKAEDVAYIRELQMRILGLVGGDMSYVNELLLPTVLTKDTKFKWKTIQFVPGRMTPNPHHGVNETNERIETSDEAIARRMGQHYIIDEETFYTEQGQRDFQMEMQFWAVSLSETMALEAWREIITPRPETRRSYLTKMQNQYTYNQAILKQRDDMFAPYKTGIYPFVQEQCQYVQRVSGRPVTIMVMPAEKHGLITNGTIMSTFKNGGERGLDRLMSRGDLPEIVPGVKVASPPQFSLDPSASTASPIDTNITMGDYVQLKFNGQPGKSYTGLAPFECAIKLLSDIENRWKHIPDLQECLVYSGRFELVSGDPNKPLDTDTYKIRDWPEGAEYDPKDPFYKLAGGNVVPKVATPHNMKHWAGWCQDEKCRYIAASPFKRYRAQGALFAAAGMHAGFTAISEPLVTKGEDAMTQVLKFNMTQWIGPVVVEPKCFQFVPNVFANGILGGSNTKFISETKAEELKNSTGWEDNDLNRESLYFMVVGPGGDIDPTYIDLRGRFRFSTEESYPCSAFYGAHFGFDQIDEGESEFVSQPISPICFRRGYNQWSGDKYVYVPGDGPFGPVEGVGSREMREYGMRVPTPTSIITETVRDR